ncbi:BolA 1-like protein [Elysia marginata]|uniref:BolA 1-like protein n=1 Tax=Elysia marginata TaxID=1093978 RepID=A0AAV4FE21_9GAST|nr:BolA 1-like protein [Elysia marginata]
MSDDKPVESAVRQKLTEALKPQYLDIINESYMHNVPKGSESHFKVVIVSSAFENVKRLQKHQLVHQAIQEELDNKIHALSIVAKTPAEWEVSQDVGKSPPCRGGAGL